MSESLVDFRRYRVTVEVATPAEDWMTRLMDGPDGCANCRGELPDPPIYVNSEGQGGAEVGADLLCSWGCLLELAASVCVVDEPVRSLVTVEEIPDWRAEGQA